MRLIIAEKPSVGRDIARVLGCKEKLEGAMRGDNDIVTWAYGHLVTQCFPEDMDPKFKDWIIEDLPIIPDPFKLKIIDGHEDHFNTIKSYMHDPEVESIVCATDAGREGELIFRYIYQRAGCTKPVERLWVSSLTYSAIKTGFENLKSSEEYDNLYESARCRAEADWLVGINGSRAFAIANDMRGLSVGRVMSPTLAILVERELERRNFVPEKYAELVVAFDGFEGKMINPAEEDVEKCTRFSVKRESKLDSIIKKKPAKATVCFVKNEDIEIPPQQLYDLTSLQRDANRLYRYSSKTTLDIAQKLYERHKAITYPRTDSRYLSPDIKSTLEKRLDCLCVGEWREFAEKAKTSVRDLFGRFILAKGVSDHHAIIPIGEAKDMEKWTDGERQIYDLIARRFIGMFFEDARVRKQTVKTEVDDGVFLSRGEKVIEAGWTAVDKSRTYSKVALPDLAEGDTIAIENMRVRIDETKPPAPHTEASLLNVMEHAGEYEESELENVKRTEYGIGTPATRAATIEKLVDKLMVERKDRVLVPTEYGIELIGILPEYLRSTKMTGDWEARLERTSKGNEDPVKFIKDIQSMTRDLVEYAKSQGDTGINKANVVGKCPLCGGEVKEYPVGYYCEHKECEFRQIWKFKKGSYPTLKTEVMKKLLDKGKIETEKGIFELTNELPFIVFKKAEKPEPQYDKLKELIEEYGMDPVNNVPKGGAMWFEGCWKEERMMDFASDCSDIGCDLKFAKASKALKKKSGWFLNVGDKHMDEFIKVFGGTAPEKKTLKGTVTDEVVKLVKESGFDYIDKHAKGGNLWIIAGEDEARELIKKCEKLGTHFVFKPEGGKGTGGKPGWFAK